MHLSPTSKLKYLSFKKSNHLINVRPLDEHCVTSRITPQTFFKKLPSNIVFGFH